MEVELEETQNARTYDVTIVGGSVLNGEITNKTQSGEFKYETDGVEQLSAEELHALSLKLNELNNKDA